MWGLWFFPLLLLMLIVGSVAGLIWFFCSAKGKRPHFVVAAAVPIGCIVIPVVGFVAIAFIGNLLQSSDTELFEEIFGYRPTITDDRMLFDDFGSGIKREVFMRAEPTIAERKRLLSIPNLIESDLTLEDFAARGASHGFTWWIASSSTDYGFCHSARIQDAHGFNGWAEFRVAECLDAGTEFPASANEGNFYVIASGRAD